MDGRIHALDPKKGRGAIVADNGRTYPFAHDGMVFWMHYDRLRVGTRVRFDLENAKFGVTAINVEIDTPPPPEHTHPPATNA